jgi:ADP-heptose:LPS heptosyltransferase
VPAALRERDHRRSPGPQAQASFPAGSGSRPGSDRRPPRRRERRPALGGGGVFLSFFVLRAGCYAAVARAELRRGRRVVVTGGPGEVEVARAVAVAGGLDGSAVLAGRTDLLELAAVVAAAGRLVCGDTGVAHLATAFRTPSVVLFGPTAPALWGPPPDRPWHRPLWRGTTGDPHGGSPDPGLLRIEVEHVLEALADLDALETAA